MATKRVYLSSTFVDLKDFRDKVLERLRRAQSVAVAMEYYAAFDDRPADKCLADVASCQIYVGILAKRYGYVPDENNPERLSITEMEYRRACEPGDDKPALARLMFQLDPDEPWRDRFNDKVTGDNEAGARIDRFRSEVSKRHGIRLFRNPEELAGLVLEAILATLQRDETPAAAGASKPSYRWLAAWDFSAYMAHKGKDFVGRSWLFRDIDAWLAQPAPRALLIRADFGVGKSAIMAELIRRNPAGAIVGWHFCQHDTQDTLNPVTFVRSLAAQFATALPGYRTLVEAEAALQDGLDRAGEDPASTFEAAIVAPLARIEPPNGPRLLVVDALDEALEFDAAAGQRHGSIIRLLANKAGRLPDWLRLLVTSRNNPDVIRPLSTFGLKEIDAENIANQADLRDYALLRCMREPLATRLCETNRSAEDIADLLRDKSLGKFLYTIRALDDLENGNISPDDLAGLPPGMDSFYLDAFERRFARAGRNYNEARDLLGVLALAKEPLPLATLAEILGQPEAALQAVRRLLPDFIRLRGKLWAFDHFSLAEWLTGVGNDGFARAGDYAVVVAAAAERLSAWALQRISHGNAHESQYLVRHLAAHLADANERRDVFRKLMLTSYDWLAERLRLRGADALIADCGHLGDAPEAPSMRALLRSSAHVLRRYPDQLPAQLLGRVRSLGEADNPLTELLAATKAWFDRRPTDPNGPILLPTTGSLRISASQIARFEGHTAGVTSLVALADGRLASGSYDDTVRLWDPEGIGEPRVLEGHTDGITSLVALADGRLASGSDDGTVRLWDPAGGRAPRVLEGHTDGITSLVALADGRLASGSEDGTVRLWDPEGVREPRVLEGHTGWVTSLVALADGRLASASDDGTVRLWDPAGMGEPRVLELHTSLVTSLVALADGRLAYGSDDGTVRLWDLEGGREPRVLEGHTREVTSLVALADGRLASASVDGTVRLWDPEGMGEPRVLEGHTDGITSLVALADGRLASGSFEGTVRLWDPEGVREPGVLEGHTGWVTSLMALADGRLASASWDGTVRLWDPEGVREQRVLEGHTDWVTSLVALADGRLASGSGDNTVRLWDPRGRARAARPRRSHGSGHKPRGAGRRPARLRVD
ncbi:MAG: DUF4062 domain-containing protein [Sterolibacteriaceae bacterium]|nr:DUF4062 domain-containing protein [Sterolibacteriaceae bacterium]